MIETVNAADPAEEKRLREEERQIELPSSLKEAKSVNSKWYFTGKPCIRGHIRVRLTSNGDCVACKKEWSERNKAAELASKRKYRNANKDIERERQRSSRAKNPSHYAATAKKWREANKEKKAKMDRDWALRNRETVRKYASDYRKKYPERVNCLNRNRKARIRENGGTHTESDIFGILYSQGGRCALCKVSVKKYRHIDHIVPISKGGGNHRRNLQILCEPCNTSKKDKDQIEFMRSKGMLL
jgi:5-methylcytosine-specific restriction endonuclease McrA